jgi:peptidoglycan/xylan/chitin deacetylase (PgdA/CDA1 family)
LISYANFHLEKIDFDTIIATFVAIIISIIDLLAKSMRLKPPKFLRRLMPDLIWDIEDERNVFLTFDDGPTPGITEWMLTTLDKYDAKATFFCLGKNVEAYPDLYQRIIDAGHRVGNHSYSHQKGWSMPTDRYVEDVDFAADFIQSDLFRPPYARITPAQTRALAQRYRLIMWDIISRDYNRQISPETCLRNVLPYLEGGSIVVFHDSVKAFRNMRYALPRTLEEIRRRGLKCARIE